MTDYLVLAPPRISRAGFAAVLEAAGSPAAPVAGACYDAIAARGVDPCFELAMFRKESGFGTSGLAVGNRSWGNNTDGHGHFVAYPTWEAGADGCAWQLAVYGHNEIRPGRTTDSALTLPYVWAPAAAGNAPDLYGQQLVAWIGDWSARYPVDAPAPAPVPGPAPAPTGSAVPATVTVQPGDSLSSISEHLTGNADRWPELYAANHGAIGSNPSLIHPGLVLTVPAAWRPAATSTHPRTVTVQAGDSLSAIAEHLTGNADRWPELYAANHGAIGSNPSLIHPGLVLTVPAGW